MSTDTLTATVTTPEAVVWSGTVTAVESENSEGVFSILPDHARFITIIEDTPITFYLSDGATKTFTYPEAVLAAADNTVTIFANVGEE